MRRAGHNPTDIQVLDILNSIDDESGYLDFQVSALTFAHERVLRDHRKNVKCWLKKILPNELVPRRI
jgi:hypothetical protein